jgi:ATP-dependent RNA helicase DeaD
MLHAIEKATRQKIDLMELPSNDLINDRRISRFKERITHTLENEDLGLFVKLVEDYQQEQGVESSRVAAALAQLLQGSAPFLLQKQSARQQQRERDGHSGRKNRESRDIPGKKEKYTQGSRGDRPKPGKREMGRREEGMQQYRIEVGSDHDVTPSNIVGAIANESGIDSQYIGRIEILDDHSLVDLPEGMPKAIFKLLKKVWVSGQQLQIAPAGNSPPGSRKQQRPNDKHGARKPARGKPKARSKPRTDNRKSNKKSGGKPGKGKKNPAANT